MKTIRSYGIALVANAFFPLVAFSQSFQPGAESIFSVLSRYDPLVVTIETDLKSLKKGTEQEIWQPAVFKVLTGDSVTLRLDVQVAPRGKMRRKTCDFPPVKVRFYEQKPDNDSIADINELKLVTSCSTLSQNEEWVQREYLIYELYNLVTEQSFRVKSATIRFEEPGKKNRTMESFSFFIESVEELAARLGGKPVKPRVGSTRTLDSTSYDRMCVFEYMIGNTDWSVRARHNIKLVYLYNPGTFIAVPYDFDYSGAVGTTYAVPNGDYPIQTVQDRFYLGLCRTAAHYQLIFDDYLSKEKTLMEHCEQASYLPSGARKEMTRYFGQFFDVLKNPSLSKREIIRNCNKGR